MLINLKTMLQYAATRKIAVGSFNVYNLESLQAVVKASQATGKPVIISSAAMAIAATLNADIGKVIILGLFVCIISAIVAGPLWTKLIKGGIKADLPALSAPTKSLSDEELPKFGITLFTILLPMLIMVSKTTFDLTSGKDSAYVNIVNFIGNPITALVISAFFAYWSLGLRRGFSMHDLLKFTDQSFAPVAGILLVIGAGGAFNRILIDSGLGIKLGEVLTSLDMSPIMLAWLVALFCAFLLARQRLP